MVKLFANSGDTDQMPQSVASDLDLHYLPNTLLGVSRLQWVNNGIDVEEHKKEVTRNVLSTEKSVFFPTPIYP